MSIFRGVYILILLMLFSGNALAHGIEEAIYTLGEKFLMFCFFVYFLCTSGSVLRGLLLGIVCFIAAAALALTMGGLAAVMFNLGSIEAEGAVIIGLVAGWALTKYIRDQYYPNKKEFKGPPISRPN